MVSREYSKIKRSNNTFVSKIAVFHYKVSPLPQIPPDNPLAEKEVIDLVHPIKFTPPEEPHQKELPVRTPVSGLRPSSFP